MDAEAIAQAVWEYSTRTLLEGTGDPPENVSERIAEGVWAYSTRTLTGGSVPKRGLLLGVG